MQSDLTLYYDPKGMASQAARLVLAECDAVCRLKIVSAGLACTYLRPRFGAVNPAMTLPVLISKNQTLTDLHAIGCAIHGAPPERKSREDEWLSSAAEYWDAILAVGLAKPWMRTVIRTDLRRRIHLAQRYSAQNPSLASAYEAKITEFRLLNAAIGNEADTQNRLRRLDELFNKFEHHIAGKNFVFDDDWSVTDAAWTAFIARLRALGLRDIVNKRRHPATSKYFNAMKRRPSFSAAGVKDTREFINLSLSRTAPSSASISTQTTDQRSAS